MAAAPTPSGDRIEIRALRVSALCGVLPEERERRQPFEVDLDVYADLTEAGVSDELDHTVNYGALVEAVEATMLGHQYSLLERMAQAIADTALGFDRVEAATVVVRKLRPPVPQHLATSGVRVHRVRP